MKEEGKLDNEQEKKDRDRRLSDDASMVGVMRGGTRISFPFQHKRASVSSAGSMFDEVKINAQLQNN